MSDERAEQRIPGPIAFLRAHEFWRRLAVTVAALLVTYVAALIPHYPYRGLRELFETQSFSAVWSIAALDAHPILLAVCLIQLALLFRAVATASPVAVDDTWLPVVVVGVAAVQASAVVAVLSTSSAYTVAIHDRGLYLACFASLVATSALFLWLADLITRHGLGSGVWLLVLAPDLGGAADLVAQEMKAQAVGWTERADLRVTALFAAAGVALVALVDRLKPANASARDLLWPALLATAMVDTLLVWIVRDLVSGVHPPWLLIAAPARLALYALLTLTFAAAYAWVSGQSWRHVAVVAGVSILLTAGADALQRQLSDTRVVVPPDPGGFRNARFDAARPRRTAPRPMTVQTCVSGTLGRARVLPYLQAMNGFHEEPGAAYRAPMDKTTFLAWLVQQEGGRFELKDGAIVMHAGSTLRHAHLSARFLTLIAKQLDPEQWMVITADFAVEIGADIRYPDVMVTRAGGEPDDLTTDAPVLIAEVLSPSSVHRDMTEKLAEYSSLPTLEAYLVASQDEPIVWIWQREPASRTFPAAPIEIAGRDAVLAIPSLAIVLPLADIYHGIGAS